MRLGGPYVVLAALWLAGCAVQPLRAPPPLAPAALAAAEARQLAREARLHAVRAWTLQGRIGLSTGHDGGSGRIDWRQDGPRFEVALSAPVTRQSWRLSGDRDSARLDGLDGGPRTGADAASLLRAATGWEIPVVALADWVRGARADGPGPARLAFAADGRLSRIEQDGWVIDYAAWQPLADGDEWPARLEARRGDAHVRLVVDQWQVGADAP
jgi:outer membrane lipoprotein LolB